MSDLKFYSVMLTLFVGVFRDVAKLLLFIDIPFYLWCRFHTDSVLMIPFNILAMLSITVFALSAIIDLVACLFEYISEKRER